MPIELQLAMALQLALQGMRTADGYFYEPKPSSVSLDPKEILLEAETELPYYHVVFPDVSGGSRRFFPADQIRDAIPGMVLVRVDVPDPQQPGAKLQAATQISADLERCLGPRADMTAWHGGLATDCRLARPVHGYGLGADPIVIVRQPFLITTHRDYGQA